MLDTPSERFAESMPIDLRHHPQIVAAVTAAAATGVLAKLIAADDALRIAVSALADIRDFALGGLCAEAEEPLDRAVEAVCDARDRVASAIDRRG